MTTATKETLFALTDELLAVDALLTESEGELTPEIEQWMIEYSGKLADKVDGIWWWDKQLKNEVEFFKAQAAELAARGKRAEKKRDWLKRYLGVCLERLGLREVKGKVGTVALQKNGGKPALRLVVTDPAAFPEAFRVTTVSLNTVAIREALEQGALPAGLAVLDPVGESVRIR